MLFALLGIVCTSLQPAGSAPAAPAPAAPAAENPVPAPRVEYAGAVETGVGVFQSFAETFPSQPDALLLLCSGGYAVLQLSDGRVRDAVRFSSSIRSGVRVHPWQVDSKQLYFVGVGNGIGAREVVAWDGTGKEKWRVSPKFPEMEDVWLGEISEAMIFPFGESAPEVHLFGNGNDSAVVLDMEGKSSWKPLGAKPDNVDSLAGPFTATGLKGSFGYYVYGGGGKLFAYKANGSFAEMDIAKEASEKKKCYISRVSPCSNAAPGKPSFHVLFVRPSDSDGEFGNLRIALELERDRFVVQAAEKSGDHDPYGTINLPDRAVSLIIATKDVLTHKATAKIPDLAKTFHTLAIRDVKGAIILQAPLPELDKAVPERLSSSVLKCHDMPNETMLYIGVGTSLHRWRIIGLPPASATASKP